MLAAVFASPHELHSHSLCYFFLSRGRESGKKNTSVWIMEYFFCRIVFSRVCSSGARNRNKNRKKRTIGGKLTEEKATFLSYQWFTYFKQKNQNEDWHKHGMLWKSIFLFLPSLLIEPSIRVEIKTASFSLTNSKPIIARGELVQMEKRPTFFFVCRLCKCFTANFSVWRYWSNTRNSSSCRQCSDCKCSIRFFDMQIHTT